MPEGGSEPTVNTRGGGRGGCQWVVVNHQSTLLVAGRGGCTVGGLLVHYHPVATTPTSTR